MEWIFICSVITWNTHFPQLKIHRGFHKVELSLFFVVFFLKLLLIVIDGCLLVLLVLRHQVVHVGLCLGELHLVHALPSVPVKESLPPEHSSELFRDPLEELLDSGGVPNERGGHLQSPW